MDASSEAPMSGQRGRLPPQRLHAHPQNVGVVAEYADQLAARNTMSTAAHSTMATMADFMVNQNALRTRSKPPRAVIIAGDGMVALPVSRMKSGVDEEKYARHHRDAAMAASP